MAKLAPAMANWMKRPIFLTSFFSTQLRGSNPRTSPAMRLSWAEASNRVMGPMPLEPAVMFLHTSAVPMPQPHSRPTPVTTTLRFKV